MMAVSDLSTAKVQLLSYAGCHDDPIKLTSGATGLLGSGLVAPRLYPARDDVQLAALAAQ